jgi:hypothetical protein
MNNKLLSASMNKVRLIIFGILISFVLIEITYAQSEVPLCSDQTTINNYTMTLNGPTYVTYKSWGPDDGAYLWVYIWTINLNDVTRFRPMLFAIPYEEESNHIVYQYSDCPLGEEDEEWYHNCDSWNIYNEPGIGALYQQCSFYLTQTDDSYEPVADCDIRFMENFYNYRVFSNSRFIPHQVGDTDIYMVKLELLTRSPDIGCIPIAWMDAEGSIHESGIFGPVPPDQSSAPPSYPGIVTPESYVVTKLEEIVLPSENMRFRIVERGTDGCATKVQYFDGLDQYGEPRWADAEFDTNEYSYLGMPGQMCPESITTENPCYFYSGTNYYVIPCK